MNLLKALGSLSSANESGKEPTVEEAKKQSPPPPEAKGEEFNAMASVLARHEEIANRVRSNRK